MLIFSVLVFFTLACLVIILTDMRAKSRRKMRSQRKVLHYYRMAQVADYDHDLAWREYWIERAIREKAKKH